MKEGTLNILRQTQDLVAEGCYEAATMALRGLLKVDTEDVTDTWLMLRLARVQAIRSDQIAMHYRQEAMRRDAEWEAKEIQKMVESFE